MGRVRRLDPGQAFRSRAVADHYDHATEGHYPTDDGDPTISRASAVKILSTPACDLIIADRGATRILVRSMSEADVRLILADPLVTVGSDGPCVAPYGVTGQGKPHPRLYGTFPRVLGHYARDIDLVGLPRAIHKMTGGVAAALGLTDRGTIAVGNAADLVLFDPETIADPATFDDPHRSPEGIEMVVVNGVGVIDEGHTGALPGRLLPRRGKHSRKPYPTYGRKALLGCVSRLYRGIP